MEILIFAFVIFVLIFFKIKSYNKKRDTVTLHEKFKCEGYVGRVSPFNFEGVNGGKKVMVYKELPSEESLKTLESDGTIQGDINKIYSNFKKGLQDMTADFIVYQHLDGYVEGIGDKPLAKKHLISQEVVDKQISLVNKCAYGSKVQMVEHIYHYADSKDHVEKWVELVSAEPPSVDGKKEQTA